jgi:hypothetical protein
VILAVAALAALVLVKKADMRHASADEPVSFGA